MKKKKYIIRTIIILLLFTMGVYWQSIAMLCIFLLYISKQFLISLIALSSIKKLVNVVFSFTLIIIIVIGIRIFVADIYLIPSSSMENTLFPKDVILVNKLKYGPKLPKNPYEIPWVNFCFLMKDNSKEAITEKKWDIERLSGYGKVNRGDVIVFKQYSKETAFVKRFVAIPGDTLKVRNGKIYTNNTEHQFSKHVKNTYTFKINTKINLYRILDSLKIYSRLYELENSLGWGEINMSHNDIKLLENINAIDSVKIFDKKNSKNNLKMFPRFNKGKKWNINHYGEIFIPGVGSEIELTNYNYKLYKRVIKSYENTIIKKEKNKFYIDNKQVTKYTFKKNYYYAFGDHRNQSHDSRFFGFVPQEKIVGKVQCVLFSNKDDCFQWNRLFKEI